MAQTCLGQVRSGSAQTSDRKLGLNGLRRFLSGL